MINYFYTITLMIASFTSVCYSVDMIQTVAILGMITLVAIAVPSGLFTELILFVISGHVPYTSITLSPIIMLLLWLVIIPLAILGRHSVMRGYWRLIELIGIKRQRHINRRVRLFQPRQTTALQRLLSTALLTLLHEHTKDDVPATETLPAAPAAPLRRRFLPLPTEPTPAA